MALLVCKIARQWVNDIVEPESLTVDQSKTIASNFLRHRWKDRSARGTRHMLGLSEPALKSRRVNFPVTRKDGGARSDEPSYPHATGRSTDDLGRRKHGRSYQWRTRR